MCHISSSAAAYALQYAYNRAASAWALRWAIAAIEIMGLTPDAEGKDAPSITYKLRASQLSPSGFVAEVRGELPSRAVPMMWNENSETCPERHPAASIARVKVSSEPCTPG